MYEKLKELAAKKTLSKKDKEFIESCCAELGIQFEECGTCQNQHHEKIFEITKALTAVDEQTAHVGEDADYILKANIDKLYKGFRVNNATLTNKIAEMLLEDGLEKWFLKIKVYENNKADKVD